MRLGVLRNRTSSGNRGRQGAPLPPGTAAVETDGRAECRPALERLRAAGAEAIVIDGGDGTVRAAVTHLPAVFGAEVPPIAILPNGNTNLVARRLGAVRGAQGLARLAGMTPAEARARSRACPALRMDFADGRHAERGFIAGWAAYAEATRIGAEEIGARHGAQIAGAVLAVLRRTLAGPERAALRRGIACEFRAEGHPAVRGRRFLGMVTTLPGPLIWPVDPFWGGGAGPVRWLDITAPPRRLALAAPLAALGRPMRWMERAGYRSGRSGRIELALSGGIVIDGERLDCSGRAVITADHPVRILC
jgi:hypothetical protein